MANSAARREICMLQNTAGPNDSAVVVADSAVTTDVLSTQNGHHHHHHICLLKSCLNATKHV